MPTNAIAQRCGKEERQSRGNCATRMLGRHKLNAHGIGGAKEFRAGKRESPQELENEAVVARDERGTSRPERCTPILPFIPERRVLDGE